MATTAYINALEELWDMLSDCVEGGRLTEADLPDDYMALVTQMEKCERVRAGTGTTFRLIVKRRNRLTRNERD